MSITVYYKTDVDDKLVYGVKVEDYYLECLGNEFYLVRLAGECADHFYEFEENWDLTPYLMSIYTDSDCTNKVYEAEVDMELIPRFTIFRKHK